MCALCCACAGAAAIWLFENPHSSAWSSGAARVSATVSVKVSIQLATRETIASAVDGVSPGNCRAFEEAIQSARMHVDKPESYMHAGSFLHLELSQLTGYSNCAEPCLARIP